MVAKIAIIINDTYSVKNTRTELIEAICARGFEVHIIAGRDENAKQFEKAGCIIYDVNYRRRGKNPFADIFLYRNYLKILGAIDPDIVLTFNIKPNIYGGMAANKLCIPYITNITGLGTAVEKPGVMQLITTKLYRYGVRGANYIFFQNTENRDFFIKKNLIGQRSQIELLPGSGVNTNKNTLRDYPIGKVVFLFASRILKDKGIDYVLNAAKKYARADVEFHICGYCDDEKYIPRLSKLHDERIITYHGVQDDMRHMYAGCSCLIHPSYYPEGMSNVILEAAACGRPVITTDRAGCREPIEDKKTGFIIPVCNENALFLAIENFLSMSWNERRDMGFAGRLKVEKEFDRQIVTNKYIEKIGEICSAE